MATASRSSIWCAPCAVVPWQRRRLTRLPLLRVPVLIQLVVLLVLLVLALLSLMLAVQVVLAVLRRAPMRLLILRKRRPEQQQRVCRRVRQ